MIHLRHTRDDGGDGVGGDGGDVDANGPTKQRRIIDLFRAVRRENLAQLKQFFDEGGDVETTGGRFHGSLLLESCRFHICKVANLLLEQGAMVNTSGGGLWTPLHYASDGQECPELVATLIHRGADIHAPDHHGRTPLHIACQRGSCDVALALLEASANANESDHDERTPVHYAASMGRHEIIALLLGFSADVSAADRELETPLHKATRGGYHRVMNLLQRAGADPNATNCWGQIAGTLAPAYKMNPNPTSNRKQQGSVGQGLVRDERGGDGAGDASVPPCVACSARDGRHYYFCKNEILQELPESLILGPDGLPIVDR